MMAHGTFGEYIKAEDFKKMHKNDFIELHNKIKERPHE